MLLSVPGFSQDYNTARLSVLSGGDIPFYFNTIKKYQDGIEITDGTTLGITIADLPTEPPIVGSTLTGWSLEFDSYNAQPTIQGSGANTLNLNTIQVEATNNLGLDPADANYYGYKDLTVAGEVLMDTNFAGHLNCDWSTCQVNLSYQAGIANGSLLGETPDYYTVEIEVILIPQF
ncbi:MAG: hypothetical protein H6585_10450 [Flavobacteriales bacterium]|nr:hypothetical protein [Flavobacteriales bacterium]MCB9448752.1 hypothetical protein [Flavobacteriales bacterium]